MYEVLKKAGAKQLYHANSVATSCSFLKAGGLTSRAFNEQSGLDQSSQESDDKDREFGIWNSIFLDHVDIHERAGRVKGPNVYGPVLFILDLDLFKLLPEGSSVRVTKGNPTNWRRHPTDQDRYFQTKQELADGFTFGTFGQMLVLETPTSKLDFSSGLIRLILDDPERVLASGRSGFAYAKESLEQTAAVNSLKVSVEKRDCMYPCACVDRYQAWRPDRLEKYFGPYVPEVEKRLNLQLPPRRKDVDH